MVSHAQSETDLSRTFCGRVPPKTKRLVSLDQATCADCVMAREWSKTRPWKHKRKETKW